MICGEKRDRYLNAPIILFVYNRKDKTEQCINALIKNAEAKHSDLYIFADGPKSQKDFEKVQEVRDYLSREVVLNTFQNVFFEYADINKGLANSIIYGVSYVLNIYGKAIIVEDDLIVTEDFLKYMNNALNFYESDFRYGSISAYTYPMDELKNYPYDIYVTQKGECWGWATWKNRWDDVDWKVIDYENYRKNRRMRWKFERLESGLDRMLCNQMNGKIDSWAVRWCYHLMKKGQWTVYPRISKAENIGRDGSGTNCGDIGKTASDLSLAPSEKGYDFMLLMPDKKLSVRASRLDRTLYQRAKEFVRIGLLKE